VLKGKITSHCICGCTCVAKCSRKDENIGKDFGQLIELFEKNVLALGRTEKRLVYKRELTKKDLKSRNGNPSTFTTSMIEDLIKDNLFSHGPFDPVARSLHYAILKRSLAFYAGEGTYGRPMQQRYLIT
jgi:hypothetical protein